MLGNRYGPGGGTAGWSAARRALGRLGCTESKLVLGLPYDDLSGGFKVWRASCLDDLGLEGMRSVEGVKVTIALRRDARRRVAA